MPPAPEVLGVGGLVRRIEVDGQIKAHKHRYANGDVGVAREVGVHLQRIGEQCRKVLETGKQQRIVEYPVDEIDGDIVAEYNLLCQTVKYPESRHSELPAAERERLVELRNELRRPHYRAGDQLREETHVEAEIKNVLDRLDVSSVYINAVADNLEDKERDAYREHYLVHIEALASCNHVT